MQRLLESSYVKETVKIWDIDGPEDVVEEEDEGALENKIDKKKTEKRNIPLVAPHRHHK
jgi:hypothetical protein